ncbi:MAG: cell wall hydrolase [Sphingomonadales bacterium]
MLKAMPLKGLLSAAGAAAICCALAAPVGLSTALTKAEEAKQAATKLNAPIALSEPLGLPQLHKDLTALVSDVRTEIDPNLHPEAQCLAQAVYFEARSEPLEGQLAVAQVVLNRVMDERYPTTICGVVFQGEQRRHKCQFSFACDGLSDRPRNPGAWDVAKAVSHVALNGYWDDVTATATHYHADYVMPYWGEILEAHVQHGRHIFYRDTSF